MSASAAAPAARREEAALAALTLLPLLPVLTTAVSLDGPVFVAVARRILEQPLDPYGFEMVWDSTTMAAAGFNRNPPLLSYYLAGWMALFGESERVLHTALLPFPLLASLSFLGLARRLAGEGLAPAALLVSTPAFLVLATALLLDVPLLACMLFAVYALLRGAERESAGWAAAGGAAAAAAGLMKYVGFSTLPLLAAGWWLLDRRAARGLWLLGTPLAAWALWGAYTAHAYGAPHFWSATDVLADKAFEPHHFLNKLASTPIFYGGALVFPILFWIRAIARPGPATLPAVLGVLLGVAAVLLVLPDGRPPRRVALGSDEAVLGALGLAGATALWCAVLDPRRLSGDPVEVFLALWLGGLGVFTALLNWHVNAADALLAGPPVLLLWFRRADLRPARRTAALWVACQLALSLGLAWADALQVNYYRRVAELIAREIGDQPGQRYFVGHWGLQHYLERQGFRPVLPPVFGRARLERGDWVVSARNVSQLDVNLSMNRVDVRPVWTWKLETALPLRTTNGDAGTGFYSHHSGYVPFGWSRLPVEVVTLGRVVAAQPRGPGAG